jgi:hypothetical protein
MLLVVGSYLFVNFIIRQLLEEALLSPLLISPLRLREAVNFHLIPISNKSATTDNTFVALPDFLRYRRLPKRNNTFESNIPVFKASVLKLLDLPIIFDLDQNARVKDAHDFVFLDLLYLRKS